MTKDFKFSDFATDAERIKVSGRWAALNATIDELAKAPEVVGTWQVELFGGLCFEVLSEYTKLKNARAEKQADPSLLAWRARNLLELLIWSTYFKKSKDHARKLYEDAGRDQIDLLSTFEDWGKKFDPTAEWPSKIELEKSDLLSRMEHEGIEGRDGHYTRLFKVAEQCGLKDNYRTANKLLSKFAHPTAMQFLTSIDDNQRQLQVNKFFGLGCCFFVGAFTALESSDRICRKQN